MQPAQRTMASVDSLSRNRAALNALVTAPTPNAPSKSPYVSGPPATRCFATNGSNARIEIAPKPKTAERSRTVRM